MSHVQLCDRIKLYDISVDKCVAFQSVSLLREAFEFFFFTVKCVKDERIIRGVTVFAVKMITNLHLQAQQVALYTCCTHAIMSAQH